MKMETWFKSVLISAIATAPLLYFAVIASAASIVGMGIPNTTQSAFQDYTQVANDLVFDLKVQAGIVPEPGSYSEPTG